MPNSVMPHDGAAAPLLNKVFSLPPQAFVEAFASALGLTEADLPAAERDYLVSAIRSGTSRLKVIDALRSRRAVRADESQDWNAHAVRREPDGFAIVDCFVRFAPDDDAAFINYTFSQICDRAPTRRESLEFEFDLRRGTLDRATIVKRVVAIARREGRAALWDTLVPEDTPDAATSEASARHMPTGLACDENGREALIFVREAQGGGWVIGPDLLRQPVRTAEGGWAVKPGWLLVGPKRTLAAGTWRIDIDVVQPHDAVLDLDVVANSGLDVLQRVAISGPFHGAFCVEMRREHHFTELRVLVREQSPHLCWLRPRKIIMQRVA